MSFSNRRFKLAVGGCLIAGFLAFAFSIFAQENKPEQQPNAPQPNQAQQKTIEPPAIAIESPVSAEREKPVKTNWEKPDCEKPKSHDEADLCQQRRMAQAADKAVKLNEYQILLGILTLIGLGFTIYYTRKTADAAIAATIIAQKTVSTMESSERGYLLPRIWHSVFGNSVTGLMGRLEEGKPPRSRDTEPPDVKFNFRNYGRTPSFLVRYRRKIEFAEACPKTLDAADDGELPQDTTIVAGDKTEHVGVKAGRGLSPAEVQQLRAGQKSIWLLIEVSYLDAFGLEQNSRFSFRLNIRSGRFEPYHQD